MILKAKYAIVTGGTEGIGYEAVKRLLKDGWNVAFCARTPEVVEERTAHWRREYPDREIYGFRADFGFPAEVEAFATEVKRVFPFIHVLVNNTGIFTPGALATEAEGLLEHTMQVNVFSAYHLTRSLLPAMSDGSTHIINICSVASLRAYPNGGSYSITKYALLGFTDNLREELRPRQIRVTAICPGAVYSRSWEGSGHNPKRLMQACEVASVIAQVIAAGPGTAIEQIVMRPTEGDL